MGCIESGGVNTAQIECWEGVCICICFVKKATVKVSYSF